VVPVDFLLELLAPGATLALLGGPAALDSAELTRGAAFGIDHDGVMHLAGDQPEIADVVLYRRRDAADGTPSAAAAGNQASATLEPPSEGIQIENPRRAIERARIAVRAMCPELTESFMAAMETAAHIPGWLAPEEAVALYRLGYGADGDILELGTFYGKSTFLIARGIRDAGKPHRVLTVDVHWRGQNAESGRDLVLAVQPVLAMNRLIREQDMERTIIQMLGWSDVCARLVDLRRVHAVFIDCGHDYISCSRDFQAVMEQIPAGRTIRLLFHDYGPTFPGVQRVVDEMVRAEPGFSFTSLHHSLFVCEMTGRESAGARAA
jgi:hypothetical protein